MILIIDNYDSFTHNLVQYVGEIGCQVEVYRNNKISLKKISQLEPTHIIISPGPGNPKESGISLQLIQYLSAQIPILGVCLGHQSIGHVYGATIKNLDKPLHGKVSPIYHNNEDIFQKMPNPFQATRYHSLIIDRDSIPKTLQITAQTQDGYIMACRHKDYPSLRGIQFHPESLWTNNGRQVIKNFILDNKK